MSTEWDIRFIDLANHIGGWSKDQSRRVGCVVTGPLREIRAVGYNGFPRGADETVSNRNISPDKYLWTEHAERNAIFQAARIGVALEGCTMYLSWFPCMACARAVVQSGITRLVAVEPDLRDPRWGSEFAAALALFREAAITLELSAA